MRWLGTLTMSLVLIVAVFGGYYAYYVQGRIADQHDAQVRALATAASGVEGTFDSIGTVLKNAPHLTPKQLNGRSPAFDQEDVPNCLAGRFCESLDYQFGSAGFRAKFSSVWSTCAVSRGDVGTAIRVGRDGRLRITSTSEIVGGDVDIEKISIRVRDSELHGCAGYDEQEDVGLLRVVADASFARVFPTTLASSDRFDKLLIVDEKDRVLHQAGLAVVNLQSIASLVLPEINEAPRTKPLGAHTEVTRVTIGNKQFHVYAQPLNVNLRDEGSRSAPDNDTGGMALVQWRMIGLVEESHFLEQALHVSALPLAIFIGVFSLLVLSFPFIKVFLITGPEPVTSQDMRNFALMGVGVVGFVVILGYGMWDYWRLSAHTDARLQDISSRFSRALVAELELTRETAILAARVLCGVGGCGKKFETKDVMTNTPITRLAYVDQGGKQISKWSKTTGGTDPAD
jgi:hypothetical protein